uniref:Uncharacterized protein n=1 Tax=Rhizophora mucronata TaxID=61149 RepID=A0A2P2KPI9_RHIMU
MTTWRENKEIGMHHKFARENYIFILQDI